jgi:hypothetical protein
MKPAIHGVGRSAIELVEEAVHVLRLSPSGTLASYYIGALPFVLGLLYFWADMSRSPVANHHLAASALGLSGLFGWMKFWQAVCMRQLRASLEGRAPSRATFGEAKQILVAQVCLQPIGLFVLPLALVPIFPFPWVYAFFQNLTALAGDFPRLRDLLTEAKRQTTLWPGQNVVILLVLGGFGLCLFLNWSVVCFVLPGLTKSLLGVESIFTRSGLSMLNTTFFATMFGLTYLCVDPILKAAYALRCFYGQSVRTGQDLKAELRSFTEASGRTALCVLIGLVLGTSAVSNAAETASPDVPDQRGEVSLQQLERSIQQVINQTKYTWRSPRDRLKEPEEEGFLGRFFNRVKSLMQKCLDWVGGWLRKLFDRNRTSPPRGGYGWMMTQQLLLYGLILAAGIGLALLIARVARGRQGGTPALAGEPVAPAPDLMDDNLGADQLPEDGWAGLARELLARGELRLALRAFYFASLAHLAARNLISLAKFKSNREYERELGRRGHAFPQLLSVFGENVSVFDRTWYGLHDINAELVLRFAENVDRIKTGA